MQSAEKLWGIIYLMPFSKSFKLHLHKYSVGVYIAAFSFHSLRGGCCAVRLKEADADEGVKAIVVTGTGKAFAAGADIKDTACHAMKRLPLRSDRQYGPNEWYHENKTVVGTENAIETCLSTPKGDQMEVPFSLGA
eukprot:5310459-Amphidinium_carterae.1